MKTQLIIFLYMAMSTFLSAQVVDGSFAFQTDPDKKYALYIPSSYNENTPQAMMLGLHPFNVNRWDAAAWRDTLLTFAEENNLLLVCPDGGSDGKVDDAIDTAFTSTLIDSVSTWYNIDHMEKYIMGFSWGAKTTYTYGLRRTSEFKGYLVIGAAINISEVNGLIEAAEDQNFFLVHGTNDSPSVRYEPLLAALEENNACVETELMSGVGHTIDFLNRNEILADAFQWLSENQCNTTSVIQKETPINLFPNPCDGYFTIEGKYPLDDTKLTLIDGLGQTIPHRQEGNVIYPDPDFQGWLFVVMTVDHVETIFKIIVL